MQQLQRHVSVRPDHAETMRYLGYHGQDLAVQLSTLIDEAIADCEDACDPAWCYRIFPLEQGGDELVLAGSSIVLPLGRTASPLACATHCAVLACTVGLGFERRALQLGAIDEARALVFDTAGSSLVEACADDCERVLARRAAEMGLFAAQRISPGYGDLDLGLSTAIINTLDAGRLLGISVTESNMLIPTKSVTALVGFFKDEASARKLRYSCAGCAAFDGCQFLKDGVPCYQ